MAKNDDVIKNLLETIETQTAALGKAPRGVWRTNGVFKYAPRQGSEYFNVNVVSDFSVMASALGVIMAAQAAFEEGCLALGINGTFTWDGYSVEDWEADFKMRISMVEYDRKRRMLNATKEKLKGLVSEKARTEMELAEISKILSE